MPVRCPAAVPGFPGDDRQDRAPDRPVVGAGLYGEAESTVPYLTERPIPLPSARRHRRPGEDAPRSRPGAPAPAAPPCAGAMPPTLASLVRTPSLQLAVLAGGDRLGAPVRWVHTSELDDPAPYLEGGELLLTTGIKFGDDPAGLRAYVHRLDDAGVVGVGVGVGLTHERVPEPLVEAAAERGLPLLEVPRPTPFIAISKAVSAALAAEQYQAVTATFEAQQELTRAALGKDGPAALLRGLAKRLDGWAALYDAAGQVVHAAPGWAGRRADRLTGEVERLRDGAAPAGAAFQEPMDGGTDCVELQSLGAGRRPRGFLAVGTGQRLTTSERYVVHAGVALLTLGLEQSRALQEAGERLGAALLRMLLVGEAPRARAVADGLYGTLLGAPVRVLVAERDGSTAGGGPGAGGGSSGEGAGAHSTAKGGVRGAARPGPRPGAAPGTVRGAGAATARGEPGTGPGTASHGPGTGSHGPGTGSHGPDAPALDPLAVLRDHLDNASARTAEPLLALREDDRLTVAAADGGAVHRAVLARADGVPGVAVGVSAAIPPESAAEAREQAERALSVALRRGRALVGHEEVGTGSVVPLLDDEAVRAFADGLLRPLREHDATARGDLAASLQAWLSRHGQWDAAAADLGVHRHTLRYRMRRVEELLGRSLDETDVRMELWLALRACSKP